MALITIAVIHDLGPNLISLGSKLVSFAEQIKAELDSLKTAVLTETQQVNAKLDELAARIEDVVSPQDQTEVLGMIADIKNTVSGIIPDEAPAEPETPAEPTPEETV